MLNWSRFKTLARISLAVVCAPLCLAAFCEPRPSDIGSCCVGGVCTVTTLANCTGTFFNDRFEVDPPCSNPIINRCSSSSTILLDGTFTGTNNESITITQNSCYPALAPAHNTLQQTFNAVTGKLVTCSVTGPTATSRPHIRVTDPSSSIVADSGASPISQTTTTTFTPTGTQLFNLFMEDCAPSAAGNYKVLVTQAP